MASLCPLPLAMSGVLRLQVLQGTDLYDGLVVENGSSEQSTLFNFVFVRVTLLDSNDQQIMAYSSNALPYSGGSLDFNEEEFLFENVSQTYSIQVAILASKGTGKKSLNVSGGEVRIPMSRLEENIPVLQWYQLSQSQSSSRSIKTSLKFEVCFFFDSRVCILETRDTMDRSGRLEISVDDLGIGNGEFDGSEICPIFPSASDMGSFPSSAVTSPDQDRIQSSLRLRSLESGESCASPDQAGKIESTSPAQFVQIDPIEISAPESTITKSHSEDVILHDMPAALPTGIVDYCLIIGPASIPRDRSDDCYLSQISRNSSSSSKAPRTRNSEQELTMAPHIDEIRIEKSDDECECDSNDDNLIEAESSELPEETTFSSICVWDKYPLTGSNHMPDKMEWFVFPDGPKIVTASERPSVDTNYFVLNSGEETQWYGVGITFFIRGFSIDAPQTVADDVSDQSIPPIWGISEEKETIEGDQKPLWVWMGVCFCLLTRAPYVDALMVTLRHMYSLSIEPLISANEANSCGFPSHALSLNLENLMNMICLEAIAPVPGVLDVALHLPGGNSVSDLTVIFNGNSLQSWPYCPHELKLAMQLVGVRTMVDLIYYAMAERKIILYSSDTSRLSIICESLRALIYPLNWCSAYIPVVPALLLDLAEAPVPYILGISSQLICRINPSILQSVVLVNCDTGIITTSIPIQRYPDSIDRWCLMALKHISSEKWVPQSNSGMKVSTNNAIQMIVLDCFLSVFSWLPECIFNVGAGYPIFNSHRFLHGYCPPNSVALAESVVDSQMFQRLVSEIHLPRLSLFVNCCKRMKYGYGYSRFIDGVSNSSTEMYPLEDRRFGMDLEENLPLGELSNPRRLLRPPYDLVNTIPTVSLPIIPDWITETNSFFNSVMIQVVIERYIFTLLSDIREKIILSVEPESSVDTSPLSTQNSNDVAFPPITFFSRSNKNLSDVKRRRKTWNFDQELKKLLENVTSDSEPLEDKIHTLRLKYRNHVLMQHKLTRDLIKVSKRLHAEYMFGEDVVMRLILRILPLSNSDGIHDMDLATALQQGSDSFSQGAARRSLVIVLSEYCDQMSIRSSHSKTIQSSHPQDLEPKFFHEKCPVELHVTAFGYATRLCKLLLQACTVHKDYLTAHGLLDICGYFYHVMFDENTPNSKLCYIQSLRSRINQHPIYQNQTLWRTVINDAISSHNSRVKKKKKPVSLLSTLRPILIHMCGSDLSMEKMEDIIAGVVRDFSIEPVEQDDIKEALKKIWTISKRYRSDKGCNLEDPEEQKGIRLVLHGGTPTRKQPLSPWHQSLLPLSDKHRIEVQEDEVDSSVNPTPETVSQSITLLEEQISSLQMSVIAPSRLPIDRVVRDIDSSSGYLDMFSRNVMFTPLPLDGNIIHEHCVTSIDVSNIWSVSGDSSGSVNVIDMEAGTSVVQHKHNAAITGVKFLPCGLIASTCSAGVLKISRGPGWNPIDSSFKSWTKIYRKSVLAVHRPFSAAVTSLALALPYNYRGKSFPGNVNMRWGQKEEDWCQASPGVVETKWFLAVGGASGGVKIYQGSSTSSSGAGGSEIMSASAPDRGSISCLNLVSSALQISSISQMGNSSVLCTNSGDQSEHRDVSVLVSPTRTNSLWSPSQAPDINLPGALFIGTSKGSVVVYDLESKRSLFKSSNEERHRALVSGIIPVRTHELLSGGFDRLVKLWDIRSNSKDCVELIGSNAAITSLAVDDYNDHKVIASCADGVIRIWDTRYPTQGRPYLVLEGHTDRITCMAQKSGILVSGSYDGTLRSWSLSTGGCLQKLRTDMKSPVSCLALEAKSTVLNSQDLVSINMDQSTTSRKEELNHPTLMSLKNIWIASGGWEGSVRVWSGREV